MDQRPVIEQVKSGFKIAAAILTSFAAVVLFIVGYVGVTTPERQHVALGWIILVVVAATLLFTVKFWATWFCGVASYPSCPVHITDIFCAQREIVIADCDWDNCISVAHRNSQHKVL